MSQIKTLMMIMMKKNAHWCGQLYAWMKEWLNLSETLQILSVIWTYINIYSETAEVLSLLGGSLQNTDIFWSNAALRRNWLQNLELLI